jgi:hypothetical protein
MCGDKNLRSDLAVLMLIRQPKEFFGRFEEIKKKCGHSIYATSSSRENFNCFAYAFGISDHPDFEQLVLSTRNLAVLNSALVLAELENGLTELRADEVQPGDIALYFDSDKLMHAAEVKHIADAVEVYSKWGPNELYAHQLWEVPLSYGQTVRYFRRGDPEELLDRLYEANPE